MKANRSVVFAVADHRHHLLEAGDCAAFYQRRQEGPPGAPAGHFWRDLDRVFDRVAIGWPRTVFAAVGKSDDGTIEFGNQIGHSGC